jgi:hypothetical protein
VEFLTAEGILLKPDASITRFRMASPLIDGFIRTRVIPLLFPNTPAAIPPTRGHPLCLDVLETLIQSIKFFDKDRICLAPFISYKSSGVRLRSLSRNFVPRESVYDTGQAQIYLHCTSEGRNAADHPGSFSNQRSELRPITHREDR